MTTRVGVPEDNRQRVRSQVILDANSFLEEIVRPRRQLVLKLRVPSMKARQKGRHDMFSRHGAGRQRQRTGDGLGLPGKRSPGFSVQSEDPLAVGVQAASHVG